MHAEHFMIDRTTARTTDHISGIFFFELKRIVSNNFHLLVDPFDVESVVVAHTIHDFIFFQFNINADVFRFISHFFIRFFGLISWISAVE